MSQTISRLYRKPNLDVCSPRSLLSFLLSSVPKLFSGEVQTANCKLQTANCKLLFNHHSFRPRTPRTVPCPTQHPTNKTAHQAARISTKDLSRLWNIRALVIVDQFPILTCSQSVSLSPATASISTISIADIRLNKPQAATQSNYTSKISNRPPALPLTTLWLCCRPLVKLASPQPMRMSQ